MLDRIPRPLSDLGPRDLSTRFSYLIGFRGGSQSLDPAGRLDFQRTGDVPLLSRFAIPDSALTRDQFEPLAIRTVTDVGGMAVDADQRRRTEELRGR